MVFAMIVNGVGGGVIITLPAAYSDRVIRAGVSGYGYLEAAFLAGAMIGAFLLGQIHPPARLAGRYLLTGLCAAALLSILFGMNRWLWSAILLWAAVSIAIAIANVPLMTMIQSVVPNHLRGRVFSIVFLVTGLLDPVSLAGAGAVADKIGVQATFITAGLILLVAGGAGWLFQEFPDTATGALDSTLSSSVT